MSGLSHVRFNPFYRDRYTDAQAVELQRLRLLYTTHLVSVFGPEMPDAFALVTEGDYYSPRYTANTLTPPPLIPMPPSAALPFQPYQSFADTLMSTLAVYEEARRQRWFGKGHPNDPTRLLGVFLRNLCQHWLRQAPSNEMTLRQVKALRQYLEALAREQVFTNEGQGHDSMTVLLHNLASPLILLERRLAYEISLQSAREHLSEAKNAIGAVLDEAAQYLFCTLAAEDRTKLPFSLVSMQAHVVNRSLAKVLDTREGLLLKQWIYTPGVIRTVLHEDIKESKDVRTYTPISLFGAETPTPLLDEKGHAHPSWLGFLERARETEAQLAASVKRLETGICPVFLESKALSEGENHLLAEVIELHGLMESLAHYQAYLHACWQLAGFGGDHCIYDQMAEALVSIVKELRTFNQVLVQRLNHFQQRLDLSYAVALGASSHLGWQANYRKAKAHQEKLLKMLKDSEASLNGLISNAEDMALRTERRVLASKAFQALSHAPAFLNQARQQVGLPPQSHYPGLAVLDSKATASNPFTLSLALEPMSIDQVLIVLLPQSPHEVVWLSQVCAETPATPPWPCFRGTYQRYCYLHHNTRLERIGQDFNRLQLHAPTPMTSEKAAFIKRLQTQLEEEQARIRQLSQNLWWPFHCASRRFFATLQQGINERLLYLRQCGGSSTSARYSTQSVPIQPLSETVPLLSSQSMPSSSTTPVAEQKSLEESSTRDFLDGLSLALSEEQKVPSIPREPGGPSRIMEEAKQASEKTYQRLKTEVEAKLEAFDQKLAEQSEQARRENEAYLRQMEQEHEALLQKDQEKYEALLQKDQQKYEAFLQETQQANETLLEQVRQERAQVDQQLQQAERQRERVERENEQARRNDSRANPHAFEPKHS